jgi:hypothetical protein
MSGHAWRQEGQALAEGLAMLPLLALLWVGVTWTGQGLRAGSVAQGEARHLAFLAAARQDTQRPAAVAVDASSWQGAAVVAQAVTWRAAALGNDAQAGGHHPHARRLRDEWKAADAGLLRSAATAQFQPLLGARGAFFPKAVTTLRRETWLLTGAAHSGSDALAQARVADSELGWGFAANLTAQQGRRVADVMRRVDRPWRRPPPDFDWLQPWRGAVPQAVLRRGGGAGG